MLTVLTEVSPFELMSLEFVISLVLSLLVHGMNVLASARLNVGINKQ